MLQQPLKEKLHALRLQGMLEALERQEQDDAARELSFVDRLALLIDQQWTWRENQALARRVKNSRLRGVACVEDIDYRAERGLNRSVIRGLTQESQWVKNHEHIFVLGPTGGCHRHVPVGLSALRLPPSPLVFIDESDKASNLNCRPSGDQPC